MIEKFSKICRTSYSDKNMMILSKDAVMENNNNESIVENFLFKKKLNMVFIFLIVIIIF